ncbi:MAG: quinolinate synthase NadA [Myxococcota bacterium]
MRAGPVHQRLASLVSLGARARPSREETRMTTALPEDLEEAILDLKKRKGAVLLAHYYQESEVQDLADVVGDSLALARAAQEIDCERIVFCGVHFMAETAAILTRASRSSYPTSRPAAPSPTAAPLTSSPPSSPDIPAPRCSPTSTPRPR